MTRAGTKSALAALFLVATTGVATPAWAGFTIAGSVGEGIVVQDGDVARSRVNFEVLPSYGVGIVSLDVGLVFHFEDQVDLLVRPGVRLDLWVLYGRVAFPLRVTDGFDWGIMAGIGADIFSLSVLSLFVEADASFQESVDFQVVPVELRLGLEIGF